MSAALKVYVAVSDPRYNQQHQVKIGVSKNPPNRMKTLGVRATLVHVEHCPPDVDAYDVERIAHDLAGRERAVSFSKEWFSISAEEGINAVKRAAVFAQTDDCTIGWSLRLEVSPRDKSLLRAMADAQGIEVEQFISAILRSHVTARSTT